MKLVESLESAVDAWTPVVRCCHIHHHGNNHHHHDNDQVGLNKTMIDLTVEPKLINVIKRLLRCEGVKYTTAIIDLQVVITMEMMLMTMTKMMMTILTVLIQRAIDHENIEHKGIAGFRGRCPTQFNLQFKILHFICIQSEHVPSLRFSVQTDADQKRKTYMYLSRCRTSGMSWSKYHSYDTISKYVHTHACNCLIPLLFSSDLSIVWGKPITMSRFIT